MELDVAGQVRNTKLPTSKPLYPLFEAVVNAIQSIKAAKQPDGRILIVVHRATDAVLMAKDDQAQQEIIGFDIIDNGIGFNDASYHSFCTSYSTAKAHIGGKGIGRFLWLVAFAQVFVESHFANGDQMQSRRFEFVPAGDGIKDLVADKSSETSPYTKISLRGFRQKYREACPRKLSTLGDHMIDHCLGYFRQSDCPTILLQENATLEELNLNDLFAKEIGQHSEFQKFQVEGQDFHVMHVRLYSGNREHSIHFCADDRPARTEQLKGHVPNTTRRFTDDTNRQFVYAAYVEGAFLNESANQERTDFSLDDANGASIPGVIDWGKLRQAVYQQCREYLKPYTEPVGEKKKAAIEKFVQAKAPMYRPILQYFGKRLDDIDPDATTDEVALDLELYRNYKDLEVTLREEETVLLQTNDPAQDQKAYRERFAQYFSKVTDFKQADLARYVCHRKVILEFFERQLEIQADGKYSREDRLHQIVFPMGKTSAEVFSDKHNLWIIDERLAYHRFLASDKQLRTMPPANCDSQKEPDIIVFDVFDKACAYGEGEEWSFDTVTIVEFKRPMRGQYTEDENPITQVCEYIDRIKAGKATTPGGRTFYRNGQRFFCHVICDVNDAVKKWARFANLLETPGGEGFFGYMTHYEAYIEITPYAKVVADAKKRNAILFDKLGLSSRVGG